MSASSSNSPVVVTGASGHIGFHVARVLIEKGYPVRLLIRNINENVEELIRLGATYQMIDLMDVDACAKWFDGAKAVFHLAADNTTRTDQEQATLESTSTLTQRIVEACESAGVSTLIYTSSVVVLGRSSDPRRLIGLDDVNEQPESPYVKGKLQAERYIDSRIGKSSLDIRRLYPSWVVGSHNVKWTPPHRLIRDYLLKGQKFYFGGGISVVDVEAVAAAHVAAFEKGEPNGKYLLGGQNVSFKDFYGTLARLCGKPAPRIALPKPAMLLAARLLCGVSKTIGMGDPIDPAYVRSVVGTWSWYDSGKAMQELDYRIPELETTLRNAIREIRLRLSWIHRLNALEIHGGAQLTPKWLITGVPGWLGNRLVGMLVERMNSGEIDPAGIRIYAEERFRGFFDLHPGIEVCYGDITDPEKLDKALQGIEKVCHIAGAIYPPKTDILYKVNADGTRALVDACIRTGVRRIAYIGTDSICGRGTKAQRIFDENTSPNPYRHYGKSKYLGEKYLLEKTKEGLIDGTSLRGFWFFGPGAPARQENFFNMFHWKRQIVFGNGRNYRSISTVDNLSHALLLAIHEPKTIGNWYWIGDEKADYQVDEIYSKICNRFGTSYRPIHIPIWVCRMINLVDWLMSKVGLLHPTIHAAGKFYFDIAGSIDAAKRDFNYHPIVTLDQEIDRI